MDKWHISKNQAIEGPITEESLITRIRKGEFKKGSLVWKKGMKTWEPIEIHFANQIAEALLDRTQDVSPKDSCIPNIAVIQRIPEPSNYDSTNSNIPSIPANSRYRPLIKYVGVAVLLFIVFFIAN